LQEKLNGHRESSYKKYRIAEKRTAKHKERRTERKDKKRKG
jgi:hypothetical protein